MAFSTYKPSLNYILLKLEEFPFPQKSYWIVNTVLFSVRSVGIPQLIIFLVIRNSEKKIVIKINAECTMFLKEL